MTLSTNFPNQNTILNSINNTRRLTIVPSDGKIIISLFSSDFSSFTFPCLLFVWWEIDNKFFTRSPSTRLDALSPIRDLHGELFFYQFDGAMGGEISKLISILWFFRWLRKERTREISAYAAWHTIAIRNKLNINRRHDGTFMKMTSNSFLWTLKKNSSLNKLLIYGSV